MWLVYWPIIDHCTKFGAVHNMACKEVTYGLIIIKKNQTNKQKTDKWICDDHKIYFFKIS